MKHYMIVDIGTGNSRVALVREDGALICVKTFENIYILIEAYEDAYFDPSFWESATSWDFVRNVHMYPNIAIDAILRHRCQKVTISSQPKQGETSIDTTILITRKGVDGRDTEGWDL